MDLKEIWWKSANWMSLAHGRDHWPAVVNTVKGWVFLDYLNDH
jgi:hypothetical protein